MSELTEKQIEALSCIHNGQTPYAKWWQSLNALERKGLITWTDAGWSITANGVETIKRVTA